MKKTLTMFAAILAAFPLFAKHVPQDQAQNAAMEFYKHYAPAGTVQPAISNAFVTKVNDVQTLYTFNFQPGGFVLMAADDASIPVLGYSFEGSMSQEIENPSTKEWVEGYSKEIYQIISHKLSNKETLPQWTAMLSGHFLKMTEDVNPLITTLWDQGCFYNTNCPADPSAFGTCGHVYTGCVATCMAQIMKYHNFPPQGVGTHTYTDPNYGNQTANFGATTYNWSSMPNSVSSNNPAVATLMYHAGVSVNMQYSTSGSGAYSEDVPAALLNYFNYHPGILIDYKSNYANMEDWKNLLRADLNLSEPIYYSGSDPTVGHAWVCDGYKMSDGSFHFNWGWSGSSNGWYQIGNLNPGGYQFNLNNAAVLHIKPYNPNLIVRIGHPVNNAVIGVGYPAVIKASTVHGTALGMKLYIDGVQKSSTTADSIEFTWNTALPDLGSHEVKAVSFNATDTVYYTINLNVAEWISQSSGFTTTRAISYLSAVDSNIVWGTAFDPNAPTGPCSDFTRTTDGGNTWTPGTIPNTTGLASAMVFGMSSTKAYVAMYKVSGTKPMGIYMTSDGGTTWTRQSTASFSNAASFPDCVHFFNDNDGWALGDPINGEFEIYTTTNGGTNWTAVAGSAIPNPLSGEFGIVGYYSAVHDTLWFGTNLGRVYHSTDKGHTWTVATVNALNGKYIKPTFRTGSHGLVQDKGAGTTGTLCETFDGGVTWNLVTTTGPVYATDLSYVPGTANVWVSSGATGTNGTSYSFNGGHFWNDFVGTTGAEYMQMSWVNNHCGFAGGVNTSATENGVYKFIGVLMPPMPAPLNFQAQVTGDNVHLSWQKPVYDSINTILVGYNVYRDGAKLNSSPLYQLYYDDNGLPSNQYNYCATAIYNLGESALTCQTASVTVGIHESASNNHLQVYPNPAHDNLVIKSDYTIRDMKIFDLFGKEVYYSTSVNPVDVSNLPSGMYVVSVSTDNGIFHSKLQIR